MYGKSSLESNWPEPWSFVGGSWRRGVVRARRRAAGSSIGDGSSWISRIRGGGGYQWVMEFVVIYPIQSEYYIQSYLIQSEAI